MLQALSWLLPIASTVVRTAPGLVDMAAKAISKNPYLISEVAGNADKIYNYGKSLWALPAAWEASKIIGDAPNTVDAVRDTYGNLKRATER